ncbi:D-alanine--D-alanine ligase [Pseudoalteromonas spongiae]|uniref:D-alanine--D-alanine ligase n=1 Tax=Pseudoalteromonas spongiae TaxID=298657 RepID=A0ABU8EN68_9GAMM|nr:D-alanine--D-alanine ligase [Pseudoalteromonas spongiae]ATC97603.1 D-alanine-D-alanine ligase [Pseudoalteromonas spongiae UST010723-006]
MSQKQYGKVAVLLGGNSAEREVSLNSGSAILNALITNGVDAIAFDPKERELAELKTLGIDRVFIALHGRGGEDGTIQGALEFMGLPYTGSGVLGSALAMDKVRCKQLFVASNLPTAKFTTVKKGESFSIESIINEFGAVMVKPSHEGSSIGMAKASTSEELKSALENAFKFDDEVLLEQWITGTEYTVSMLNNQPLSVIEMKTPRGFYDYEAKYKASTTSYHCPADLSNADTAYLQMIATQAFALVGAKDWGRVDAMRDQSGEFYLLEVNTVPGMTEKSLVPMAAKDSGRDFAQLVLEILDSTL